MVKVVPIRSQQCLVPLSMLLVEGSSERGLFRDLFNHVFRSPELRKYISYEGHLFLENVQILREISKMQKQIEKMVFVSEIVASELAFLNYFIKRRILVIGSGCGNKES